MVAGRAEQTRRRWWRPATAVRRGAAKLRAQYVCDLRGVLERGKAEMAALLCLEDRRSRCVRKRPRRASTNRRGGSIPDCRLSPLVNCCRVSGSTRRPSVKPARRSSAHRRRRRRPWASSIFSPKILTSRSEPCFRYRTRDALDTPQERKDRQRGRARDRRRRLRTAVLLGHRTDAELHLS